MSDFYIGKEENGVRDIFLKRIVYNADTQNDEYENLVDFNFAEKHLYGRVDRLHFTPIVPGGSLAPFKKFRSTISVSQNESALNFVADAFDKLAQQFEKMSMAGRIDTSDRYLSQLVAYKSYQNPSTLYSKHLETYKLTLASLFLKEKANIVDFNQFILKLMPSLEKSARKTPFTMPAYVKSNFCPMHVSGLVVEISDLDPNNDEEKMEMFYNSNNWEFYLNACRSYGFMVDKLIPWRLVADIASPQMLDFAAQYGLTSTNQVLNGAFRKVHASYFPAFKNTLYNLYVFSREDRLYIPSTCANGEVAPQLITPETYAATQFFKTYSDEYFLVLYCKIRFFEEESQFTEGERHQIIDDCVELAQQDLNAAIATFETIVNKPFDYRGSLGYIKERQKKITISNSEGYSVLSSD